MGNTEHQEEPRQARRLTALWRRRPDDKNDDRAMIDVYIFDGSFSMQRVVELDADYYDISGWLHNFVAKWWNEYVTNLHITGEICLCTYKLHEIDVNTTVSQTEYDLIASGKYKVGDKVTAAELGFLPLVVHDGSVGSPHTMWVTPETIAGIKKHLANPIVSLYHFDGLDQAEHWIGTDNTTWRRSIANPDIVITLHGERI